MSRLSISMCAVLQSLQAFLSQWAHGSQSAFSSQTLHRSKLYLKIPAYKSHILYLDTVISPCLFSWTGQIFVDAELARTTSHTVWLLKNLARSQDWDEGKTSESPLECLSVQNNAHTQFWANNDNCLKIVRLCKNSCRTRILSSCAYYHWARWSKCGWVVDFISIIRSPNAANAHLPLQLSARFVYNRWWKSDVFAAIKVNLGCNVHRGIG